MPSDGSITELISRVKAGDGEAARRLWDLCAGRLLALAQARLGGKPHGVADEEDVVLSAFASFFRGAERGQFPQVHDREDLWNLLAIITTRKALDLLAHAGRQKRRPATEANRPGDTLVGAGDVEQILDPHPPPDIAILLDEECQRLLRSLGDVQLRSVAVWKLEGYTNEEVAAMLGCTLRTVERKLRLIRTIWEAEVRI